LAAGFLFIQFANSVILYLQSLKFQTIALKIIQQLRIDVFAKVQALGMKFFDRTPTGAIVSRVTNDTEAIKEMFVSVLAVFIQSAFLLIGIFIAMFSLDFVLALYCLLFLPLIFLIIHFYRKFSSKFYQEQRERLSQLNAKLNESLQGMGIIQIFRQEKRMRREFDAINEKHFDAGMRTVKVNGLLLRPAVDLVYILAVIILLTYFGITSWSESVEVGVIFAFVNYINRFFEPVNQVMEQLSFFQQSIVSAARVFRLLDEKEMSPEQHPEGKAVIERGEIEFRNVSFSYDGKKDVLKNISFTVRPGETVAIVGQTGSGKSSIINLFMRFYEFDRGDILIDGRSIKSYGKEELRKKIGLVLQDPFMYYGSIKYNIRLNNPEISDGEIVEAAKFVQAHPFIEKLPGGYDHVVSERGSTLSTGQRQLITFARAIAANPKILILDEATSNIDTETEEAIQTALEKMRKGRTTIAIAHRLSTIQNADLILVLHKGEIVERGTHPELLAKKGLYYKMYLLQNGLTEKMDELLVQGER
jgi:ATP-binding cassette subfamily B protein